MIAQEEAEAFAAEWVAAWNAHDLERILSHYDENVELISPLAARRLAEPTGRVCGKTALRAYFAQGLEAIPDLRFRVRRVLSGVRSVALLYERNSLRHGVAEIMELGANGKVVRVLAHYEVAP
jgi:predicted ester cyclase